MALSHARPYHFNSRPHEEVDIILKPCCESVKYFNSRPHEEVDSGPLLRQYHRYHFNSRPHEEVDQWLTMHSVSRLTFQLTTSRGGRLSGSAGPPRLPAFQLTTSRGGRLWFVNRNCFSNFISTHDLTRRSTFRSMSSRSYWIHFNSRPHEEVDDQRRRRPVQHFHFNSRPHEEVDFFNLCFLFRWSIFQLTTSRGGRQSRNHVWNSSIVFQLTTSRGGRQPFQVLKGSKEVFQLTTSRGGRLNQSGDPKYLKLFQLTTSRGGRQSQWILSVSAYIFQLTTSRGGRHQWDWRHSQYHYISTHDLTRRSTESTWYFSWTTIISTHDLTRRSTWVITFCVTITNISTHDLTRRSTNPNYIYIGGSIFQLTTSRGGRHSLLNTLIYFSTFQLTTSRGGRRLETMVFWIQKYFNSRPHEEVDVYSYLIFQLWEISTHDLTRRSTWQQPFQTCRNLTFQLTTSRGGRRIRVEALRNGKIHFNSRPHEEVDWSLPHLKLPHPHFNSRPHEEVDQEQHKQQKQNKDISTHDLTRRSTFKRHKLFRT